MRSEFLLGVLGLIVVVSCFFGGTMLAGLCHDLLTPNLDIFYMIWMWICLIPFWWICVRTLSPKQFDHPVATYVGFLPLFLFMDILILKLGSGNPWLLPAMAIAYAVFFAIAERVYHAFARR